MPDYNRFIKRMAEEIYPEEKEKKDKQKEKDNDKVDKAEIKWLKGFTGIELDKYLIEFPKRKENTLEFKRRYKWVAGQWRKKL